VLEKFLSFRDCFTTQLPTPRNAGDAIKLKMVPISDQTRKQNQVWIPIASIVSMSIEEKRELIK
jgi:hypothetical protein